jgi:diguanylate cyclase (GGDEF)-like protein
MSQPISLHSVKKSGAKVIAHDPRHDEKVISNKRYLRVLELSKALSRNLDLENIVEAFSNEIKIEVPHAGFHYAFSEIGTSFSQGNEAVHSANYRLSVQNESIGELTFFRHHSFSNEEICNLEDLLCALVYPVKNALMYRTVLKSAYSDSITGLNNRTSLEKCLPREVELAKRHQQPMAILVMDLDGFKEINDNHGHDIGDQMLREVGQVILKTVRNTDLLYRYGGDEFVSGLVQTDLEGAIYVSERIRSGIENLVDLTDLPTCKIKISIGLTMVQFTDSYNQAFKRADKALYSAKLAGKNQVSVL